MGPRPAERVAARWARASAQDNTHAAGPRRVVWSPARPHATSDVFAPRPRARPGRATCDPRRRYSPPPDCSPSSPRARPGARPWIWWKRRGKRWATGRWPGEIVSLVDTLRADHTQPYGYGRDTTPELAKFAGDAVVFEQAIAQASWTKPSVASLFTSLLPGKHRAVQLRDTLDSGHVTLAEMLQAKGFATGAVIASSVIYSA